MTGINVPAVATGVVLGFLAIIVLVSCVPPITRFLGDLFCCPWHIPFTKKRKRNADEDIDPEDLPYPYRSDSPIENEPVDNDRYNRLSAAYMSAVSVVDPAAAKEEMRRSAEYRREHSPYRNSTSSLSLGPAPHHHQQQEQQPYGEHLNVPGGEPPRQQNYYPQQQPHYGDGGGYYPQQQQGYHHNTNDYHQQQPDYVDVQIPVPSHAYSPPEMSMHSGGYGGSDHGYFQPQAPPPRARAYDAVDYDDPRQQQRLVPAPR